MLIFRLGTVYEESDRFAMIFVAKLDSLRRNIKSLLISERYIDSEIAGYVHVHDNDKKSTVFYIFYVKHQEYSH